MNQKQIGTILICIGVLLALFVTMTKSREDAYIQSIVEETGSCFLDDGTCLHSERSLGLYIAGWVLSFGIVLLGVYLSVLRGLSRIC